MAKDMETRGHKSFVWLPSESKIMGIPEPGIKDNENIGLGSPEKVRQYREVG